LDTHALKRAKRRLNDTFQRSLRYLIFLSFKDFDYWVNHNQTERKKEKKGGSKKKKGRVIKE
jgi:hypothetical protein